MNNNQDLITRLRYNTYMSTDPKDAADEIERLQIEINKIRDNKYLWWVRDNWQGGVIQTNVSVTYEFLKDLEDAVGDGLVDMIGTKVAEEIRVEWRKHYER